MKTYKPSLRGTRSGSDAAVAKKFGAAPCASTGGLSAIFPRPAYQGSESATVGDHRGVPDVSMSASLSGGILFYESFTGKGTWSHCGVTSAASPEFAGIVAIADQYAGRRLGLINPALYACVVATFARLATCTY